MLLRLVLVEAACSVARVAGSDPWWKRRARSQRRRGGKPPDTDQHRLALPSTTDLARQRGLARLGRSALEGADPVGLAEEAVQLASRALGVACATLYRADDAEFTALASHGTGTDTDAGPGDLPAVVLAALTTPMVARTPDGQMVELDGATPPGAVHTVASVLQGPHRRHVLLVSDRSPWYPTATDLAFLGELSESVGLALQRRGAEEEAHHRALHDSLTGLANQALFVDRLRHALARHQVHWRPVGVAFIDIDGFKAVNDNHGHAAADKVLIEVAERLQHAIRPVDTVARFGGDEFTLLCEELGDLGQLEAVAHRVRNAFSAPFAVRGTEVRLTASIGMSYAAADSAATTTAERLLQEADTAMYAAKARGRDCWVCYDDTMREGRITRLVTRSELREALAYDQLTIRYQPVVDLGTEQVRAVEGLVRWRHPTRGLVSPREFIPISEESGLIEELGAWVLRHAVHQAASWHRAGFELSTSVNLSAHQMTGPNLVDTLDEVLHETGLPPGLLCLEITETVLMTDVARSMTLLGLLDERGVRIAVDDFGTGYSSLAYLKRLPVDVLKIDRVFVDAIAASAEDRSICAAIIGLAHSLGLETVAEGVETRRQAAVLRELGCDRAQGYLFARPAHPDELDLSSARTHRVGA